MKKILFTFGVLGLLTVAACETPQPTTDQSGSDTTTNTTTQPTDTTMNRPDSTPSH